MKLLLLLLTMTLANQTLFDFHKDANISRWYIVDDGVMGGLSKSTFSLTKEGQGCFKGRISLDNNGGFASVRFDTGTVKVKDNTLLVLKVKGDGKKYQVRLKENSRDFESYIQFMETSEDWQTIKIPLQDFYPSFRGRTMDKPNFNSNTFNEFGLLFGNKQAENFELLIDSIWLE